ncbi:MAG: DUF4389 domain-containing protein [Dehalococcoidia bacterium]|nr:DUF4389 domain-containing protein [Dehalococcoidia bacterium]
MASTPVDQYAARFDVDYDDARDRVTVLFRILLVIPILVVLGLLEGGTITQQAGEDTSTFTFVATGSIGVATALMIVFRQRYPRWWFDFQREFARFSARVGAYLFLLRDEYPSTEDEQAVHLELDYPDATALNRWLPLVKWLLAIPHYIVLFFLGIGAVIAVIVGWFAILITGRLPRGIHDYLVGVARWGLRVQAYAFLLLTDRYPPFSLR